VSGKTGVGGAVNLDPVGVVTGPARLPMLLWCSQNPKRRVKPGV